MPVIHRSICCTVLSSVSLAAAREIVSRLAVRFSDQD
jgi:hypothetical protein